MNYWLFLVLCCFGFTLFYSEAFLDMDISVANDGTDRLCEERGGQCAYGRRDKVGQACIVNNQPGTIVASLCWKDPDLDYRCCVPNETEEEKKEEDPAYSDRSCDAMGGVCTLAPRGSAGQPCSLSGGESGCYIASSCRASAERFIERPSGDGMVGDEYESVCCAPKEWCESKVDYEEWKDIYSHGICPLSIRDFGEIRNHCSQGPYNAYSHSGSNSVDIRHYDYTEDKTGTEFFLAPEDGCIKRAEYITYQGNERCGGTLVFEANDGVVYTVRHAFILASRRKGYDKDGWPEVKGVENCTIKQGEVLAKIALPDDDKVIQIPSSCATGPHFHVKIDVDTCADCWLVDKYNCELHNKDVPCGRCWRDSGFDGGTCKNCGIKCCQDCCPPAGQCCPDPKQYLCKKDINTCPCPDDF